MAGVGVTRVADCPVCLGTFKDPRVLPCGHTFCLICITEYGRSRGSDPDCPNCRTKFQIPSTDFDSLPKNYSLNSVLYEGADFVGASRMKVIKRSCKKHSGEELILYCVQCSMVICLECMEEDHRKHDCCRVSRFAKEARSQLEGYTKTIKPILCQVTSQKTQLQEKSKKFCDLLNVTQLAINEEYEKNKRLLDDHRRLLLEELGNEKQRVTKELKMRTDEIEAEYLKLASFNTQIEEMLQGADETKTFDIVCQYRDFKDGFDRLKQIETQTKGQVSITDIKFIPGNYRNHLGRRQNAIGSLHMEYDTRPEVERSRTLLNDPTRSISKWVASDYPHNDMAGENAANPGGNKKDDDEDDNHCVICMDDITDKKELSCKHKFCRGCIDQYLLKCQPKCPVCGKVFGILRGDQPKGTITTKETGYRLNGYKDCGAIEINYSFYDGVQEANHPNPGAPYKGTHQTAYLPANKEGRKVLRLLRIAFDAGLVFTIGLSDTTGQENVVVWNDVHHKTSTTGQYGYPDPTYLQRVTEQLAAKGIR